MSHNANQALTAIALMRHLFFIYLRPTIKDSVVICHCIRHFLEKQTWHHAAFLLTYTQDCATILHLGDTILDKLKKYLD